MIFKLTVKTHSKIYDFYMETHELMRFVGRSDMTEEFKIGEITIIPGEIKEFTAEKYYMSKVTDVDKDE